MTLMPPLLNLLEDFSRPLEMDELPIMRLIKTQKKLSRMRIGLRDPKTAKPKVYDVSGEPVVDTHTGEFLGGVVILKDVTEYMDTIAAQKEFNVQQLADIANCIPNMIWTTTPDGMPDWFSPRWYEYTGLSAEDSLGPRWVTPFHPDDARTSAARWMHSISTGVMSRQAASML